LQQQQLHATYTGSNSNTTQQQHQQILLLNFNWFSAGVAATAMLPAAVESSAASRKKLSPCSLSGHLFLIEIALSFWSCMPLSFVFFKPPALFASLFCLVYSSAGVAAALLLLLACCKSFAGVDVDCGSNALLLLLLCGISLYDFAECVDLFAGEKGAKEKGGMEWDSG